MNRAAQTGPCTLPPNMVQYVCTSARFTLLEALRSRLLLLFIIVALGGFALAEFLGALSITEAREIKLAVMASMLRLFAVVVICLVVLSNGLGERKDRLLQIMLSLPMPRYAYLFGKTAGFAILSLLIAVGAGLSLCWYAPLLPLCYWMLSLFCEQLLLGSFSLLCLLTFSGISSSFIAVIAFYLLARSVETLGLLAADPLLPADSLAQEFMESGVQAFALLLPDLHAFTRSDWLLYGAGLVEVGAVLLQTLLYLCVLVTAALFDLYRMNF